MSRRLVILLVVAVALASLVATAGASVAGTKAPVCAGKTKAKAIKAVKRTWATMFDTAKTVEQRLAVIEDATDPEFALVVDDIVARFGTFLETATADVHSVTCADRKTADVAYDLVLNGEPAPGVAPPATAVLDAGKWKVSQLSICDLFGKADAALLESGACAL
jgi:hypothetical protein